MSTVFVEQRYTTDCMIAAIAMALALPYEEVYQTAINCGAYKSDHSTGIARDYEILEKLGLVRRSYTNTTNYDFESRHIDWCITPEFFRSMVWGRPVILSVPSLNKVNGHHALYYDGHEVFDPNPPTKNRYTACSFDTLKPSEITMFRPNIAEVLKRRREQLA